MKTQLELLKEAVALAEAHPEAQIRICATSDELLDNFGWTAHKINRVDFDWWYADEENIHVGLQDIKDCLDDAKEENAPETTDDEAMAVSTKTILIYTGAA